MRICHGVNENPSFIHMCFGTQQKVRKWQTFILLYLHVDIMTFQNIPNNILFEYQHTPPVEHC